MERALAGATRQLLSRQAAELLEVAFLPSYSNLSFSDYKNPILVNLILEGRPDPNHEVEDVIGGTIWVRFLELITRQTSPLNEERNAWLRIVDNMLFNHGDLDALVKVGDQNLPAEAVISRIFKGKHVIELRQSIAKMRDSRKLSQKNGNFPSKLPPGGPPNLTPQQSRPQSLPPPKSSPEAGPSSKPIISRSLWPTKLFRK